jgi:hypothetical protein
MPPCPTNHAIAVSSQEPPVMLLVVVAAQAAAIEPVEAQTQPTTNAVAVPPASCFLFPALSLPPCFR